MKFILLLLPLLLPTPLLAHTGSHAYGLTSGFTHPVFGLDHILAMLSVGILSAQMGGRALWSVPLVFVGFMLVGWIFGMLGVPFFTVEIAIAVSVLVLGLCIASSQKFSILLTMAGVAFFALFHGHAHGVEMPEAVNPTLYALGFILGTTLIHLLGVALGWWATRPHRPAFFLRWAGVAIALVGAYFLTQSTFGRKEEAAFPVSSFTR